MDSKLQWLQDLYEEDFVALDSVLERLIDNLEQQNKMLEQETAETSINYGLRGTNNQLINYYSEILTKIRD